MEEANFNHIAITLGNVSCRVVEKYGIRKIGDPADAKKRKWARVILSGVGIGAGFLGTTKKGAKIPDPIAYGMTAIGSSTLGELLLGPENILNITGKMFYEELAPTMPDVTRLRSKMGQLTQEATRLKSENAQLKSKLGTMFPEETIPFSPSSTAGVQVGSAAEMMAQMGTLM